MLEESKESRGTQIIDSLGFFLNWTICPDDLYDPTVQTRLKTAKDECTLQIFEILGIREYAPHPITFAEVILLKSQTRILGKRTKASFIQDFPEQIWSCDGRDDVIKRTQYVQGALDRDCHKFLGSKVTKWSQVPGVSSD